MPSDARIIAARYADALFDLAAQQNQHDQVKADLENLMGALVASPELARLLESPVISREDAEKAIAAVLQALHTGELTAQFLALLGRNRRLSLTRLAAKAYLARLSASRGELAVQVTSAQALTDAEQQMLSQAIAASTGKQVSLNASVNPALLGGLQLRIGSRLLDTSIAGKLDRLGQKLKNAA